MSGRRWDGLREQLLQAGVGWRQVRRLIAEWQGHHADLRSAAAEAGAAPAEAQRIADERLGDDAALLRSCVAHPELFSVAHRHPRLFFGIVPVLVFALLFVVSIAVLVQALDFLHASPGTTLTRSSAAAPLVTMTFGFLQWVLPALVVAVMAWWALRQRARTLWPVVGMVVVSLIGAATNLGAQWSATGALVSLSGGIGFGIDRIAELLVRGSPAGIMVLVYLWRNQVRVVA